MLAQSSTRAKDACAESAFAEAGPMPHRHQARVDCAGAVRNNIVRTLAVTST